MTKIGSIEIPDDLHRVPFGYPRERVGMARTLREGLRKFVGLPSSRARKDSGDVNLYSEVDAWIKRIEAAVESVKDLATVADMPGWIEYRDSELKRLDEQLHHMPDMGLAWMFKGDPRMLIASVEDKMMREMFRVFDEARIERDAATVRRDAEYAKLAQYVEKERAA